jgi:hypothetical protein
MRRRRGWLLALLVSLAAVDYPALPAMAAALPAPAGTTSLELLLNDRDVQVELKLNREQADKAKKVCQSVRRKVLASVINYRAPNIDKAREAADLIMDRIVRDTLKELPDVLNADQLTRLKQLDRQQRGPTDPATLKELDLTIEQSGEMAKIEATFKKDLAARYRKVGAQDNKARTHVFEELWAAAAEQELAVLTPAQQTIWKELTGEPFVHLKIWHNHGTKPPILTAMPLGGPR